jgi:hypothetical protein
MGVVKEAMRLYQAAHGSLYPPGTVLRWRYRGVSLVRTACRARSACIISRMLAGYRFFASRAETQKTDMGSGP